MIFPTIILFVINCITYPTSSRGAITEGKSQVLRIYPSLNLPDTYWVRTRTFMEGQFLTQGSHSYGRHRPLLAVCTADLNF